MSTASVATAAPREPVEKGLKAGALGLLSSIVIGVASTAPAYSLAATLGFVVVFVGLQTPIVVMLAFVPMLFIALGYKELNRAEPDCGTTFTWGTRAFGPVVGWLGGWGIIAADVIVMASLAQIAGQYGFLLFNANGIGSNATSGWVLLVGLAWIGVMTYICYRGIEISAAIQKGLLTVEVVMLAVFAAVALGKVATGNAPRSHINPSWSWFNPMSVRSFSVFIAGMLLMLFIYWGWDTAVAVNEETADRERTPGRAAVISTIVLLGIYAVVTLAAQSFAGIGDKGIGLGNSDNQSDVLSVLGKAVFGSSWVGSTFTHLLILMVLSSAAASTLTTILPNARTTLSMASYKALPDSFAKMERRYLTPSVSTIAMGVVSAALYASLNYLSGGNVIADSVTALGLMIAFYYGLTGFASTWYFRHTLRDNARNLWLRGILPGIGGAFLLFAMGWSFWLDWKTTGSDANSYTTWLMPFSPHWRIGGVFIIGAVTLIVGVILMAVLWAIRPAFFRGETLTPYVAYTEAPAVVDIRSDDPPRPRSRRRVTDLTAGTERTQSPM